ncbi:MAG: diacylglycerol kinase family protein [Coriobacteriia bacterium]|nr:diacylglycerol kinase family protein [Coriobacteriia bacterium]
MRIKVIVNPGAGQPEPVLSVLNQTLGEAGIEWDVDVTHASGDAFAAARQAAEQSYDLVGVYGGDGTIKEVASALAQGGPPMAILPGGTGNTLAEDLGIPAALVDAAALVASGAYDLRPVDMGRSGDDWFIVRLTMGLEVSIVEGATRERKERLGWLAYAMAGLQAISDPPIAQYRIDIDGEIIEAEGIACIIANTASTGVMGLKIAEDVDTSDGMLDVIVIEHADFFAMAASAAEAAVGQEAKSVRHWRGKGIRVTAEPPQSVVSDGECGGETPVDATVVPGAIKVVVPCETRSALQNQ